MARLASLGFSFSLDKVGDLDLDFQDLARADVKFLKVGAQIEELDMRDITVQKAGIDSADILVVYDNLLRGSRNHLRAFMKVLIQQGGTNVPQNISQAEFDAIVNSAVETGP